MPGTRRPEEGGDVGGPGEAGAPLALVLGFITSQPSAKVRNAYLETW